MRTLSVFNQVSVDGYFADVNSDMSWAHKEDAEWKAFTAENAAGDSELLFGRVTYEMMAGYWPTPMAAASDPVVADQMNRLPKIVFSRTLDRATWTNTRVVTEDPATVVRGLTSEPGPPLVVMGSGTIVSQLAAAGVIGEYQLVVNPILLVRGKSIFAGLDRRLSLESTGTRTFANGNVLLRYAAAT